MSRDADLIRALERALTPARVLTGDAAAPYGHDWTGAYVSAPLAVVQPGSTAEVAEAVRLTTDAGVSVVPIAGRTGLAGGGMADGAVMISVERLNRIRALKPGARVAVVEAGVVLQTLQDAARDAGLVFPLSFGARGSAMIGGCLSTNAGGSNVLRYGTARELCLGIEVVLPSGEVLNLMSELRKDNTGYDLRDLFIGAEGTLGIITAAVVKLFPAPRAHATAMLAAPSLDAALTLLNRLQEETGGAVEAFEFMPALFIEEHLKRFPRARAPFEDRHEINILVEIAATSEREATPGPDGVPPLRKMLEAGLEVALGEGLVLDAVIARNEAERREMWDRREAAGQIALGRQPLVNNDVAVPLDRVAEFLRRMAPELQRIDPQARVLTFSHLGDGNIHYTVWPSAEAHVAAIAERTEAVAVALGGTFSAEHGVGVSKQSAMARLKDPVALSVMRGLKSALDPKGLMNPGKLLPD